ncbi:hypothetical protein [Nocardia sp. NPDC051463]|uniref:hypothetical protein n=1 Tax=Nocardia sp. NPDC051463 TaxID=3154845 RepID=UPI0034501734
MPSQPRWFHVCSGLLATFAQGELQVLSDMSFSHVRVVDQSFRLKARPSPSICWVEWPFAGVPFLTWSHRTRTVIFFGARWNGANLSATGFTGVAAATGVGLLGAAVAIDDTAIPAMNVPATMKAIADARRVFFITSRPRFLSPPQLSRRAVGAADTHRCW